MIGICVIWLGVLYQRNGHKLEKAIQDYVPASLRDLVPERARMRHHAAGLQQLEPTARASKETTPRRGSVAGVSRTTPR
jgi:hypothetical protein